MNEKEAFSIFENVVALPLLLVEVLKVIRGESGGAYQRLMREPIECMAALLKSTSFARTISLSGEILVCF